MTWDELISQAEDFVGRDIALNPHESNHLRGLIKSLKLERGRVTVHLKWLGVWSTRADKYLVLESEELALDPTLPLVETASGVIRGLEKPGGRFLWEIYPKGENIARPS